MTVITKEVLKQNIENYLNISKISKSNKEKCIIALQLFSYINNHFRSISYFFEFSFLEVVKNKAIQIINDPNSTYSLNNECAKFISLWNKVDKIDYK